MAPLADTRYRLISYPLMPSIAYSNRGDGPRNLQPAITVMRPVESSVT